MASTPKGFSAVAVEQGVAPNLGLYTLLTETAVSSLPVSLTNVIPTAVKNATGMHLRIQIYNHTVPGQISIAGTAPLSGAAVTSTTANNGGNMPVPENPGQYVEYTTPEIYGAVNASGVTLGTGLTGGFIAIYGVQAAKSMVPGEIKMADKRKDHNVVAQRSTFAMMHMPPLPLAYDPEWEYQADFYPDNSYWTLLGGANSAPSITNLPSVAVSVMASASVVSGGTGTIANQPTAPGMVLQYVIGGAPATTATVTVTGTNMYGETGVTEVLSSTKTAGTYYGNTTFTAIASIAFGAFGGSATLAINAYFGYAQAMNLGDTLSSLAWYQFDGTASKVMPYGLVEEISIEGGWDKELKLTAKGPGQAVLLLGDTTLGTQLGPTFSQPQDEAVTGWQTVAYIDAVSGTAGTTQNVDVIDFKIAIANKYETKHTSYFYPPGLFWNRAYRGRREVAIELTLDMSAATYNSEYATGFKQGKRRLVQLWIMSRNQFMGTVSGTAYYKGWKITMPTRWIEEPAIEYTISKPNVELKVKGMAYLDASLGYDCNLVAYTTKATW